MKFNWKCIAFVIFFIAATGSCGQRNNSTPPNTPVAPGVKNLVFNIASSFRIYTCQAATVSVTDKNNSFSAVTSDTTINLSSAGSGKFYSDPNCSSLITSTTLSAGKITTSSFYFKDMVTDSAVTLTASSIGFNSGTFLVTILSTTLNILLAELNGNPSPYNSFVLNSGGSFPLSITQTIAVPSQTVGGTGGLAITTNTGKSCWYSASNASGGGILPLLFDTTLTTPAFSVGAGTATDAGVTYIYAVDPTNTYLYAAGKNLVVTYAINPSTCALTNLASFSDPGAVAVSYSNSGNFLYVLEGVKISSYKVTNGVVASTPTASVASGATPLSSVFLQVKDHFLYIIDNGGSIFSFSYTSSGSITSTGAVPSPSVRDLFADPSGSWVYSVNPTGGPVFNGLQQNIVDPNTGVLTIVNPGYHVDDSVNLVSARWFNVNGSSFIYAIYQNSNVARQFLVNPNSGVITAAAQSVSPVFATSGNGLIVAPVIY